MINLDTVQALVKQYKAEHLRTDRVCCSAHQVANVVPKLVQTIEDLLQRLVEENGIGKQPHPDDHAYLSTACLHGVHNQCRQVCKFCGAACECKNCEHPLDAHVHMLLAAMGERRAA